MFLVGSGTRTALMGLIYKKCLRLTPTARRTTTIGEMVNLMQVNTEAFTNLSPYVSMIWSGPFQIMLCVLLLWQHLGVASLAGIVPIFLLLPLQFWMVSKGKKVQLAKLKTQDSRIKITNEIISGIKVLKFYGWELSFRDIVEKIRKKELLFFKSLGIINVGVTFTLGLITFSIATSSFIVYILMDPANVLDAETAFVSLSLFNILKSPLLLLPRVISGLVQVNVSIKRIEDYLLRDEMKENKIEPSTGLVDDSIRLKFNNVNLSFSEKNVDDKILTNLSFSVKKNELIGSKLN
jgi:ABC-type transport system involved in cytochrome bd biosynthesis fused ATPase/permease subunit